MWYDGVGRPTATADYGTNGDGSKPTRPDSPPASSDTVLVSTTEYNSDGEAYKTIDPAGREDRQEFDDAGRAVKTIQNYTDGDPSTGAPDEDVTVETAYNADGQVLTLTAKNPTTGDQTTSYVYGSDKGGITPQIYRNDLLRAEIYPDSDDVADPLGNGADGVYDRVEYRYNRQGERIDKKDQNGTIQQFQYDSRGRETAVTVTTLGTNVDGSVRRITRSHEVRGMVEQITSYATVGAGSSSSSSSSSGGGDAVNQVKFEYNDLGRLLKEYQEHDGVVDANTPYVGYNFDDSSSGGRYTKRLRPTSLRYPNGRLVHYTYGDSGSIADAMNRIDAIKDDDSGSPGDTLAQYTYVGAGTIVVEDYVEPDVKLDYVGDGSYSGFDRFGRVVDQKWYDYGASAVRDQYTYGYDRASNRLYRENTTASGKDEYYTYDGINRLLNFDRGDLNAQKTAISGTPVREEDFSLDPTGNWADYVQKILGTTDLDQDRTHNKVNEITAITATVGDDWTDPVHDRNGNMTTLPKPSSPTAGLGCQYDPWNRLVEVTDGQTVVGKYEYDALNRRVKKHLDSQSPESPNGIDTYVHYFYNRRWQVLETRDTDTETAGAETLLAKYQHVWSARYIDAPILRDADADDDSQTGNLGKPASGLEERLYYVGDANFNVTCLVDTTGDAVERYVYHPYGKVTIYTGTWSSTRSSSFYSNAYLCTGREYEGESGLYHYRERYYHAELGRFLSRDPGLRDALVHLLQYAASNPVRYVDPHGLAAEEGESDNEYIEHHPFDVKLKDGQEFEVDCVQWKNPREKCDSRYLKASTGEKLTQCETAMREAEKDSGVKELKEKVAAACKESGQPLGPWGCLCCWGPCTVIHGGFMPRTKDTPPAIFICDHAKPEKIKGYMVHELTHALKYCQRKTSKSCGGRLKEELEAFRNQGSNLVEAIQGAVRSACSAGRCRLERFKNPITRQNLIDMLYDHWQTLTEPPVLKPPEDTTP